MYILVSGGTGFIGSHLVKRLVRLSHEVTVIKRKSSNIERLKDVQDKISFINADEFQTLEKKLKRYHFDIMIHTASVLKADECTTEGVHDLSTSNIVFPTQLLHLAAKYNVKKIINTSSYFDSVLMSSQQKITKPFNYYTATKLAFEQILQYFMKQYGMQAVTLRLSSTYGEYDNKNKIIPLIIDSFIHNKPLKIKNPKQVLDFIYINDVIDAYIAAILFLSTKKSTIYKRFDIGTGKKYTPKEIVKYLENISKREGNIKYALHGEVVFFSPPNLEKSKRFLNWTPKTSIKEGLHLTYHHTFQLQHA